MERLPIFFVGKAVRWLLPVRLGIAKVQSGRIHVSNIPGKANQVPFVLFPSVCARRSTEAAFKIAKNNPLGGASKISKFACE